MLQLAIIFYIFISSTLSYDFTNTTKFDNSIFIKISAYNVASKANLLNSTKCRKELQSFQEALDHRMLWSLKVLDASGVIKPGFLFGNNYWMGSRDQCLNMKNAVFSLFSQSVLNNTLFHDLQKELPFELNYFVAHLKHNGTIQYHVNLFIEDVITLGLCLPASCTIKELSFILNVIFNDKDMLSDNAYPMDLQLIQVKNLKNSNKWLSNNLFYIICAYLGFTLLITAIGTLYEIFIHQKCTKINKTQKRVKNIEENTEINSTLNNVQKLGKVLMCFSVSKNTKKIFNTKLDTDEIPVIHGLKFLSMCLIIFYHYFFYMWDSVDNKVWVWNILNNYVSSLVNYFPICVDVYFFSSGCLVTYLYLRNKTDKMSNKPILCKDNLIEVFIYIIKRFIRLTPTYMIVLILWQLSSIWLEETSQFYMYERSQETCSKYWWRNFLYINNFFSFDTMCMQWSWYLANDMQFYIIAIILLILSTTYFYVVVTIMITFLIISALLNGYTSYIHEYILTLSEIEKHKDVLYSKPWMRINPYIIGMISGYILRKLNNNLILKKKTVILCWSLVFVADTYVLRQQRHMSVLYIAIYMTVHRILWTTSIAWIVIICSTKHGGILNKILSHKIWIPLSRLTYCAYLINPVILRSVAFYSDQAIHYEFLPQIITILGYIIIIYFCSYALSLLVEMPYISLTRLFIRYSRHSKDIKKVLH